MILPLMSLFLLQKAEWGTPQLFCKIENKLVSESSGIAPSHLSPNAYYTHNDSGDTARFFRFDQSGRITGTFTLAGAQATDWEDMASRTNKGKSHLYLGDIGDNARRRPNIKIYRVAEPTGGSRNLTAFDTYTLTYPDGAKDCEALLVDPKNGDIFLVTKERGPESFIYRLPAPPRSGSYTLQKVGVIKVNTGGLGGNLVTAGDASSDGRSVVLRTYSGAVEFSALPKFGDWWKSAPNNVPVLAGFQSEAICYSRDSGRILTTSEGSPCPVGTVSREKSQ